MADAKDDGADWARLHADLLDFVVARFPSLDLLRFVASAQCASCASSCSSAPCANRYSIFSADERVAARMHIYLLDLVSCARKLLPAIATLPLITSVEASRSSTSATASSRQLNHRKQ